MSQLKENLFKSCQNTLCRKMFSSLSWGTSPFSLLKEWKGNKDSFYTSNHRQCISARKCNIWINASRVLLTYKNPKIEGNFQHLTMARQLQPWKYLTLPESIAGILLFPVMLLQARFLAMPVCTPSLQCLLPFTAPWEVIFSPTQLRMSNIATAALTSYCSQPDWTCPWSRILV